MSNRLNTLYNTFIFKTIPSLAFKNGNWWLKRSLIHSCNNSTPRMEYISSREFLCNVAENFELLSNKKRHTSIFSMGFVFFSWANPFCCTIPLFLSSFSFSPSFYFSQSCNWLPLYDNAHDFYTCLVTSIFHRPLSFSGAYENNFMIDCCLKYFHKFCLACTRDNIWNYI